MISTVGKSERIIQGLFGEHLHLHLKNKEIEDKTRATRRREILEMNLILNASSHIQYLFKSGHKYGESKRIANVS